jgi:predicted nucleotidyltransferase component of viral defense system
MLNKEKLDDYKRILNFNLGQVEKDYLQQIFLLFFSRYVKDEFIFKGGTALQKCYGLNRFSEDLDFTFMKEIDINKIINKICEEISSFGFDSYSEETKGRISRTYRIKIKGPLFDGNEKSIASLRIEISLRNDLILPPETKEIISVYNDIPPYLICTMNLNEILAEKIRTVLQRQKARDIYDIHFILKKGAKANKKLIQEKCQKLGLDFDKDLFTKRVKEIKKIWQQELLGYVSFIPDFNEVLKEIIKFIESL